jgi:hypothetical protein
MLAFIKIVFYDPKKEFSERSTLHKEEQGPLVEKSAYAIR